MKHRLLTGGLLILALLACGCSLAAPAQPEATAEPPAATEAPAEEPAVVAFAVATEAPTIAPTEIPATPVPEAVATIGAVGDVMVMPQQLADAYNEAAGAYDFSRTFAGVKGMFSATDLMCANLECSIAGAQIGYSSGVQNENGQIRFNAPDSFAADLKNAGIDCVTTANNHTTDCGTEGIVNTINAVRAAGLLQTGTFATEEARREVTVTEVNGIKIGILASTDSLNSYTHLSTTEKNAMVSRLQNMDAIVQEIQDCRDAGAEFIVMFAHWDHEYQNKPGRGTKNYADALLAAGVDAVIGSHPHVVQPFEYRTVTRADGSSYTGLVVYSLGNFLSNMTDECTYGLYVRLTIRRGADGKATLTDAAYMPTLCFEQVFTDGSPTYHQLVPALADPAKIPSAAPLSDKEIKLAEKARAYVMKICGEEVLPVIADADWTV